MRACSSCPSPIPPSICNRLSTMRPAWRPRRKHPPGQLQPFFSPPATTAIGVAFLWHEGVAAMRTLGVPKGLEATPKQSSHGPLDFELLDLYVAIFIVVPVALFLKSLWS